MLTVENVSKSYGDKVLFDRIDCTIKMRDRIGLIGVNGTGKSSLLRVIAGMDAPEEGVIRHAKDYEIKYLQQDPDLDEHLSVMEQIYYGESTIMKTLRSYEEALMKLNKDPANENLQENLLHMQQKMDEHDAWEAGTEAKVVLTKLGITMFDKNISELSGGQKKRVALAKALIQPADLLILDEPTNHLDNMSIEWLESYLQRYKGAILLVTHDRYFLNRVTNRIFELDKGRFYTYEGNYELFLEKKAEREALEASMEQKHHNTLRRELAWLQRGARARSTKQRARVERVQDLKEKKFQTSKEDVNIKVGSKRLGKEVIELKSITKSYRDHFIISSFDYLIKPGDRIGIIGPNGSGKTTLLNLMATRVKPDEGTITIGETVRIGYYKQGDEDLNPKVRIIDFIKEVAQEISTIDGSIITAEQMLEHFLFSRREQWNYIGKLSGGEKRRLYLLKILMTEPNVLFLDEPTNDLDIQTLGILEEYLAYFPGVVVTVSHDRYFLDRVVDQLLIFKAVGSIGRFYGNYSEYLAERADEIEQEKQTKPVNKPKERKQRQKRVSYKDKKEWEHIEEDIMALENKVEAVKEEITEVGSDVEKAQNLYEEQQKLETALEVKMERWEELALLME